ncbi:hypothetical protein P7C71_g5972, partial [Lecanoromycetidae sp. Uapishka_2]
MARTEKSPSEVDSDISLAAMKATTPHRTNNDMVPMQRSRSQEDSDSNYTSDDYCEFPSSSDRKPTIPRARAKKVRKAAHQTKDSKPLLRPAKDILSRIRHDPALKEADFIVGYNDRHAPEIMEMDVSAWKGGGDVTDEEWIPQHRIVYFSRKGEGDEKGEKVWDREKRLDRLFGSGVVPEPEEQSEHGQTESAVEQPSIMREDQKDAGEGAEGGARIVSTK